AWLEWRQLAGNWRALPMRLFFVQLSLNVGWSVVFFGARQPGLAFGEILLLWTAIASTAASFWRASRTAAVLMIPYLAWVTFASALNFAVWRKNRETETPANRQRTLPSALG